MVGDVLSRRTIFVLSLKHCTWRFTSNEALLAQLKFMMDLKKMMIDSYKNDVKLQQRLQLVRNGDKFDYSIEEDGGLFYKNRLCVLNVH